MPLVNVPESSLSHSNVSHSQDTSFVHSNLFYILCLLVVLAICFGCKKKKSTATGENSVALI